MTGRRLWGLGTGMWNEYIAGTSQVLVVTYVSEGQQLPETTGTVIIQKSGLTPIADWVCAGVPLPLDPVRPVMQ